MSEEIKVTEEMVVDVEQPTPEDLLKESNDRYLRLFAEFDNYKKRVQKERVRTSCKKI